LTTLENHEENVEHLREKMTYNKNAIGFRRAMVLELDSQGYTYREIMTKLQIAKGTVSNDLAYLRKQAQDNLQKHIHETVPEEYAKCMLGMKRNLKQTLEIAESAVDPKTKLQARAIVNDCYKSIMDLTTNGVVITDAMKYVIQKSEQVNTLQKMDKRVEGIEERWEEETTTNGVF
jgi:transposase